MPEIQALPRLIDMDALVVRSRVAVTHCEVTKKRPPQFGGLNANVAFKPLAGTRTQFALSTSGVTIS
jgi:hypothetical protein